MCNVQAAEPQMSAAKGVLRRFVATRAVHESLMQTHRQEVMACLERHLAHDWGEIPEEDKSLNQLALGDGGRLFSAYQAGGQRIWIITDAQVTGYPLVTTILFPSDY